MEEELDADKTDKPDANLKWADVRGVCEEENRVENMHPGFGSSSLSYSSGTCSSNSVMMSSTAV